MRRAALGLCRGQAQLVERVVKAQVMAEDDAGQVLEPDRTTNRQRDHQTVAIAGRDMRLDVVFAGGLQVGMTEQGQARCQSRRGPNRPAP